MPTPNIVPKADQEGGLGTAAKSWGKLFIENATDGGTAAVTISNLDIDQVALDINANNTTAHGIDLTANSITSGYGMYISLQGLTTGKGLYVLGQDGFTTTASNKTYIDAAMLKTGATADGVTNESTGVNSQMIDAGINHANSTVNMIAFEGKCDSISTQGTNTNTGMLLTVTDATNNYGIDMTVEDGGIDFISKSSADAADYFTMATTTNGATTLTTVDGGAAAAHFEVAADGNITLTAGGNIFLDANAGDYVIADAELFKIFSVSSSNPIVEIQSTTADATSGVLKFSVDKHSGGVGADGDDIGAVLWSADDDGGNVTSFAQILGEMVNADDGDEAGQVAITVANDGTLRNGITMTANKGIAAEVDVTIANGAASTTTVAGDLAVTSKLTCTSRTLEVSSTTDGNHSGDVVYFGTGTVVVGKIYHYKSDGSWELADANAAANCDGLLGVALDGGTASVVGMLLRGMVTLVDIQGSEAVGDVLYLSESATGDADCVAPAGNGDVIRIIGYCLSTDDQIWFNPDSTFVEVSA